MPTFVLRLWTPAPDSEPPARPPLLRGVLEEVGSGRASPFRTGGELVGALQAALAGGGTDTNRQAAPPPAPPERRDP